MAPVKRRPHRLLAVREVRSQLVESARSSLLRSVVGSKNFVLAAASSGGGMPASRQQIEATAVVFAPGELEGRGGCSGALYEQTP